MTRFRQSIRKLSVALTVIVTVLGAGVSAQKSRPAVPQKPDDRTIAHVVNRLGFGPAPGDIERVRRVGLVNYIEDQLDPARIPDRGLAAKLANLQTLGKTPHELAQEYYIPAMLDRQAQQKLRTAQDPAMMTAPNPPQRPPTGAQRGERMILLDLSQQKILRAAYSERQLEEVLVDFWFNHFNVFAGKGPTRLYVAEFEREAIRPHVFGNFRNMLQAVAESPAMLFYLDNWQSAAPADAPSMARPARSNLPALQNRRSRGLNENYARELMELHTLGVDGGYTQKDVQEVARAFTGWTIALPRQGGEFTFNPRMHDAGEKMVLGRKIKAGGGKSDGEQVLDVLAAHPSTAKHISLKLARRFVSDDPPPGLVDRAAKRFRETRGNLGEVVRTIITSPEFFEPAAYRAKIKTPFEFVVSAIRATAVDTVNVQPYVQGLRDMGMPLYMCQPPTGYSDKAEAWVNTGALLNRMNFAVGLTSARVRGLRGVSERAAGQLPVSHETIVSQVLASDLSESTKATVGKATTGSQAVALVLGSPEFQKR